MFLTLRDCGCMPHLNKRLMEKRGLIYFLKNKSFPFFALFAAIE